MRIKFRKGKQREFLQKIIIQTECTSLRGLISRGIAVNYQTLKSYYNEIRTLPEGLFNDLCRLAGLNKEKFKFNLIDEHWGQSKGGRK